MGTRNIPSLVLAILVLGASAWGFVELTRAVRNGDTQAWDERFLLALRDSDESNSPIGSPTVEHAARDITALGSMTVVILMTGAMTGYFFLVHRRRDALLLAGSIASGMIAFFLVKHLVARERPAIMSTLVYSETHSFPSGHVMLATVFYFAMAILVCRHVASVRVRAFVWCAALSLAMLVAFTRTHLGIHWPSDVVAGMIAGIGWTSLWWIISWLMGARLSHRPDLTPVPAVPDRAPVEGEPALALEIHQPDVSSS